MKKLLAVGMAALLLSGCSKDPMSVKLPQNAEEFASVQKYTNKLEGEDARLYSAFMGENALALMVGSTPIGMTIGEAIEHQRKEEIAYKLANPTRQEVVDSINKALDVTYVSYTTFDNGGQTAFDFKIKLKNKQEKPIIGIKGEMIFKDASGKTVGNIDIERKDLINPNSEMYIQLRTFPIGEYLFTQGFYPSDQVSFDPYVVLFDDGTSLSIANTKN